MTGGIFFVAALAAAKVLMPVAARAGFVKIEQELSKKEAIAKRVKSRLKLKSDFCI